MVEDPEMALTTQNDSIDPVNHGFTVGGDITLRSLDGVDFSVHSVLLALASPVFSDMLSIGACAKNDVIPLGEPSDLLALMLKFIYPFPTPTIKSFEELNQAFHVADKYQLDAMKSRLREKLTSQNSPVSMKSNPTRALGIAWNHGLEEEKYAAMELVSVGYDFQHLPGLEELAKVFPSAYPCIQLIGAQSLRTRILVSVIFNFRSQPMKLSQPTHQRFHCERCVHSSTNTGPQIIPEWQVSWANKTFWYLRYRPVHDWDAILSFDRFETALSDCGVPSVLPPGNHTIRCDCPDHSNQHQKCFHDWAVGVLRKLSALLENDRVDALGWLQLNRE